MKRKWIAGLLAAAMLLGMAGCGSTDRADDGNKTGTGGGTGMGGETVDMMKDIKTEAKVPEDVENNADSMENFRLDTADFSIRLLQENVKAKNRNVMVSPFSVLTALSMTVNGAAGETKDQMLSVLAPNQDIESLNANWRRFTDGLVNTQDTGLRIANSVWFKDNEEQIRVKEEFLQTNAAVYQVDIYKAAFDEKTLKDVNTWVSDKTEGRIENILNEIPKDAVMYLVNALAFDAEWKEIYEENRIRDGEFFVSGEETQTVSFMNGEEDWYLQDENAIGFVKPYKEGYSFVALLPKEGISVQEYVKTLSGEKFLALLSDRKDATVYTLMPKFKAEYEVELKDILTGLGMTDAFDEEKADFSGIGTSTEGNICISRVLHKTYIAVDEKGTEAGAATVVEMQLEAAVMEEEEVYRVYLNRPFVYAIVENETNVPLFIGTVDSITGQ